MPQAVRADKSAAGRRRLPRRARPRIMRAGGAPREDRPRGVHHREAALHPARPAHRLLRPRLLHRGHPPRPRGHGRGPHRLGRGVRLRGERIDQGRARLAHRALLRGPGRHPDRRHPARDPEALPQPGPRRPADLRALGPRHRALGPRGQGGGASAAPAARRRRAHRGDRLCEPLPLWRRPGGRARHRGRGEAGLSLREAPRGDRARGARRARGGRARDEAHGGYQLSLDARRGARDGAALPPARSPLAGGAGVAAGGLGGVGARARGGGHRARRRREHEQSHRLQAHVRRGGRHLRPAQRHQDRRPLRAARGGHAGRGRRRDARAALALLRPRPPGHAAIPGRPAARAARGADLLRPRARSFWWRHRGARWEARGPAGARPRR